MKHTCIYLYFWAHRS